MVLTRSKSQRIISLCDRIIDDESIPDAIIDLLHYILTIYPDINDELYVKNLCDAIQEEYLLNYNNCTYKDRIIMQLLRELNSRYEREKILLETNIF